MDARRGLRPRTPRERLIVALDVPGLEKARDLVDRLVPAVTWFKIGSELFTAAGPGAVALVLERGARVFLDLKFHDIPHTVAGAVHSAVGLGVSMLNLHIAGGEEMLRAGVRARGPGATYVIGVTALTSGDDGVAHVVAMAQRGQEAELDGVVASPREAAAVKAACGASFLVVAPGIRRAQVREDDQRRTASPGTAVRGGSDFLVVGRPVLQAPDPRLAVEEIVREMSGPAPEGQESER